MLLLIKKFLLNLIGKNSDGENCNEERFDEKKIINITN